MLSGKRFAKVAAFIENEVGIQLPESKRNLVETRLRKRMMALQQNSLDAYLDLALSGDGAAERIHLIDALTTNKTAFLREPDHFKYLDQRAVGELVSGAADDSPRFLRVWCAACSTGEEAYTIAFVLGEAQSRRRDFRFSIWATDISVSCLQTAKNATYTEQSVAPVPMAIRKKYFLRSRDKRQQLVRMAPELRSMIEFQSLNLVQHPLSAPHAMDVIFCRNVMIYFSRDVRNGLICEFARILAPGGYLFVGHSESLHGIENGLEQVGPMIYRKPG